MSIFYILLRCFGNCSKTIVESVGIVTDNGNCVIIKLKFQFYTYCRCCRNAGFELAYRDLGNIHFSFFTMQFFPPILKITIPKHMKRKSNFFLNVNHREKLCFTEFSTRIYWNSSLVASGLFFLFTQSNKFYKFHWHGLRKRLFIK